MTTTITYSDWQDVKELANGFPAGHDKDTFCRIKNSRGHIQAGKIRDFAWETVQAFQVEVTDE